MARVTKSGENTYNWDVDATRARYGWMLTVFTGRQSPYYDLDTELVEVENAEEDDYLESEVVRAWTHEWEIYLV